MRRRVFRSWRAKPVLILSGLFLLACTGFLIGCASAKQRSAQHLEQADHWAAEGKTNEAIVEYRRAIQLDPKDPAAHLKLAKIFFDRQDLASCQQQLSVLNKIAPDNLDAQLLMAEMYLKVRAPDKALEVAQVIIKKNPDNPNPQAMMISAEASFAMMAMNPKDKAIAQTYTDRVLRLEPANGRAWFLQALLQISDEKTSEGEASLLRAINYDPTSVSAVATLSFLMARRGDLTGAETTIRKGLAQNPQNIPIHYLLGAFLFSQNRRAEAEETFKRIKALGDSNSMDRGALARYYVEMDQPDVAIKEYLDILKQHPDDVQNSLQLAALYIEKHDTPAAEKLVSSAAKTSPNDPATLLFRGRLRVEKGQIEDGINDMHHAAQLRPRWYLPEYLLGLAYLQEGKRDLGEAALNSALQLEPNLLDARLKLAELALDDYQPEKAIAIVDKALDGKSQIIQPYLLRTVALAQEGRYDEAEKDALPLIDEFPQPPNRAMTYRILAEAKYQQSRFEEAHTFAKQSMSYDSTSERSLYLLGASQIELKKADAGLAEVQTYVRANPKWAFGYRTLAELQAMAGRYADAERSVQTALEIDPNFLDARRLWSRIELRQLKFDAAMEQLSIVVKSGQQITQPELADIQIQMGQISEMKKDWPGARAYYENALKLAPENALAKNNLASVLAEHYDQHATDLDYALKLAQDAKEAQPDSIEVSDTLAWVLVKKKNYSSAIPLLKDCVHKDPKKASYLYHLGDAYKNAGRKPEAEQALQASLKLQPEPDDADAAKKDLENLNK